MLCRHVFLIGFSGSGKSSVGVQLARRLKARFYDTDVIIERDEGRSVAQVFEQSGERYFRLRESDLVRELCKTTTPAGVIALGGGAFQTEANRRRMLGSSLVVYLSCAAAEIHKRLHGKLDRPLVNARPREGETPRDVRIKIIRRLLKARVPNYRKAHIRCTTTGRSIDEIVEELHHRIQKYNAQSDR